MTCTTCGAKDPADNLLCSDVFHSLDALKAKRQRLVARSKGLTPCREGTDDWFRLQEVIVDIQNVNAQIKRFNVALDKARMRPPEERRPRPPKPPKPLGPLPPLPTHGEILLRRAIQLGRLIDKLLLKNPDAGGHCRVMRGQLDAFVREQTKHVEEYRRAREA